MKPFEARSFISGKVFLNLELIFTSRYRAIHVSLFFNELNSLIFSQNLFISSKLFLFTFLILVVSFLPLDQPGSRL